MAVLTLPKESFIRGEFAPILYGRSSMKGYEDAVRHMENAIPNVLGGFSNRGGFKFVGQSEATSATEYRLIPFQFSVTQSYMLVFTPGKMEVIKDGAFVQSGGSNYDLTVPYTTGQLSELRFTQSADVIYITHPSHEPRKITRTSDTSWTISTLAYSPYISAPTGLATDTATPISAVYLVSAVDALGVESEKSSSITSAFAATLTWNTVSDALYYNVYYAPYGVTVSATRIGRTTQNRFTVASGDTSDLEKAPIQELDPFNSANNYPGACGFFEQRLLFARTNTGVQDIWGSVIGDYENFNVSVPTLDSDSYNFTLDARKINDIKHLVPLNELLLFTSGAVWQMTGGAQTSITPYNVSAKLKSQYGACSVIPEIIGNQILFVTRTENTIRELSYSEESGGYNAPDLTKFSRHLFEGYTIKSIAYQEKPNSILWCVRSDGVLLGLSYHKDFGVYGWHRHTTDGEFIDLEVITESSGEDAVYAVIKRTGYTSGSATRYLIEKLEPGLEIDSNGEYNIEDAFYVDSGYSYSGSSTSSVTAGTHLYGKTLVGLLDGKYVSGLTANSSGVVSLPFAASDIHIGLPYNTIVETLDLAVSEQNLNDRLRDVKSIVARLINTRNLEIGPQSDRLEEVTFRTPDVPYDTAIPLFNGDKEITVEAGDPRESRVYIKNSLPVPLTISSLQVRVDFEED